MRYRARRKNFAEEDTRTALINVTKSTGKPIIETTVSIIAGMLMLLFGSYAPIRYFGMVMCMTLASTNLATLFILPAYLIITDRKKRRS